jgi:serine/threonine-protein kinase
MSGQPPRQNRRLDSWKEIANYLARDVRTVIRWEKERGLPVHRVPGGKKAAVFAFVETLDAWLMADAAQPSTRLLAVLPFSNAAGVPAVDTVCDGLTEALTNRLAQTRALRVMARSSVARYRGPDVDLREVGRTLGVPVVVTGVVREERGEIVVNAELVDTSSGLQLWGARYSRPAREIWTLELEVVEAISDGLDLHLTASEQARLTRESTRSSDALRLVWRGRQALQRMSGEGIQEAIACYQKALELDPRYGKAHAALAEAYGMMALGYSAERPKPELLELGERAVQAAIACDPNLAEAHCARAILLAHTYAVPRIEAALRRAIELQPSYSSARNFYGYALLVRGQLDEARKQVSLALEVDPVTLGILLDGAAIHAYARDLDFARELMDRAKALYDPAGTADASWLYVDGLIAAIEGDYRTAIGVLERCTRGDILHTIPLAILGFCYAKAARPDRARAILERLAGLPSQRHATQFSRAAIFAGLGEIEEALASLERAYEERNPWLLLMHVAPWFDDIRSEPRLRAISERMAAWSGNEQQHAADRARSSNGTNVFAD